MKSNFSSCHPLVNFLYFLLVLSFSMLLMHPVALLISLAGAFSWSVYLGGRKSLCFGLLAMLPVLLLMALFNVAFNHAGATILAYLPSGNPLTLESLLYGLAAAAMLVSVILWFSCFNQIITSDKFVYLFGRLLPALSLLLSMVLRFVPRFQAQLRSVSAAQHCLGRDLSSGSVWQRLRHGVKLLSILVTWSLENAIVTADSMKSRGYGLAGRSAFLIYRLDGRDHATLWLLGGLGLYLLAMLLAGGFSCRYFPLFQLAAWNAWSLSGLLCYLILCLFPLLFDLAAERRWQALEVSS